MSLPDNWFPSLTPPKSKILGLSIFSKYVIKNLSKSIIDEGRHHLSIIDWACYKVGNGMGINQNDYEPLMNMTLKDILSKIETKSK